MKQIVKFYDKVYGVHIYVSYGHTMEQYKKDVKRLLKKEACQPCGPGTDGMTMVYEHTG